MRKIRKNRKRIICIILCCITLVTSLYYVYDNPEEVKAFAIVDDAVYLILAIMAACSAGYVGYEWFNQSDIAGYPDDVAKAEESLSRLWDNAVTQFGGDYNPDDFDPDNDDPNEKPPKWEKLKIWAKTHPGATLALGAGGALATVVTAITPEILKAREEGKVKPEDIAYTDDVVNKMLEYSNDYPYIVHFYANNKSGYVDMYKTKPLVYKSGNVMVLDSTNIPGNSRPDLSCVHIIPSGELWKGNSWSTYQLIPGQHTSLLSTNLTIYDSLQDAVNNYGNDSTKYPGTINPGSLPLSTDIMDWFDRNPGKDAPDQPLYDNVKLPTQDDIEKYAQDLKELYDTGDDDEEHKRVIVDEFIHNITNVTDKPDPGPGPNPDPDPDPGEDSPSLEPGQLEFDFKLLFPFCVPFDLIDTIKILDAEPQAPCIDIPIPYLTDKGLKTEKLTIDLSKYDEIALLMRRCELLLFIIGLILLSRNIIRG